MRKKALRLLLTLSSIFFSVSPYAFHYPPENYFIKKTADYNVLDAKHYAAIFKDSRDKITHILQFLAEKNVNNKEWRLEYIILPLLDTTYLYDGAMGEGDWQPTSTTYQGGAVHLQQFPVYRLDGFDCQTFTQTVMALYYAKNLAEFDKILLQIAYGATRSSTQDKVHYYNRNHFIDADFNRITQLHGLLTDVTATGALAPLAKVTSATISRTNWFKQQKEKPISIVNVLAEEYAPSMTQRWQNIYPSLYFSHFAAEIIYMTYVPKEQLAIQQSDGSYRPNQSILNKIPTPAVVEMVRDAQKWRIGSKNIKEILGTELTVSHTGLIYRKNFQQGEVIYQKITCDYNAQNQKTCAVSPVTCTQKSCLELMLAHATNSYPHDYFWYQQADGHYVCTKQPAPKGVRYTMCNRVEQIPLFDYLTHYQYGAYWHMSMPSLLGVHIEKLR